KMHRLAIIASMLVILAFPATCFAVEYLGTSRNDLPAQDSVISPDGEGNEYQPPSANTPNTRDSGRHRENRMPQ
ncbi:hypothetical protein, partial [Desulfovibrio oxyclinae]|uniref:hypothetical protein n=1 Tax=Desulfovibrio oxyclinae TaxID=63560 RepID=UPI001B7F7D55